MIFEHVLIMLGVLSVAAAMVLALQPRRSPQGSFAWILFIILMPYIAVPLFLVLGFRKSGRAFPAIRFQPRDDVRPDPVPVLAGHFQSLGASGASIGNLIDLHHEPRQAADALREVIASASHSLDVQLYIVARDDSGRDFLGQLTERARAGVKVRLGIDGLGSLRRPWPQLKAFRAAGGELRFFSPLDHPGDAVYVNLRNHRKIVIADGTRVWTGGRNVGDDYLASPPGRWLDLSCTVAGPVVDAFNALFASDWQAAGGAVTGLPEVANMPAGNAVLQLIPAGPDEDEDVLHDCLVSAIHRADRRVWIATPYFVPTDALLQALATAAQAGVDVRIYLPNRSNQWTTDLARGAYLRILERKGVQIHRFMPGMMHAKVGMIDDAGWLGSANFDIRSMFLNFELALWCHDPDSAARIEDWFAALAPGCEPGLPKASPLRRLVEGIFRLSSPIL